MPAREHTPGPWEYEFVDYGGGADRPLIQRTGHHFSISHPVTENSDVCIACSAPFGTQGDAHVPSEADARLMAAAPDLLAALEAVSDDAHEEHAKGWTDAPMHCQHAKCATVRAAIAKARG